MDKKEALIKDFIERIPVDLEAGNRDEVMESLHELHPVDVAEIISELPQDLAIEIVRLLKEEHRSEVFAELEEEDRVKILESLSPKEIAEEVIEFMNSDDAADLIAELPEDRQEEVIQAIEDTDQANDIIDLLNYPEDTAGGLMAKELVKVYDHWNIAECEVELRKQAEEVDEVHTVYAVDDKERLQGIISLKRLILSSPQTKVEDIIKRDVISVKADLKDSEVAAIMEKYDLVVVPVVNEIGKLMGRITIDDVVDVIKEEAEKDYQMASGISEDVESSDSIWDLTRARFPWLLVGMMGGLVGAQIIGIFDIEKNPILAAFIPLIAAMGGNVGVQSSAIVVQGIANKSLKNTIASYLLKELGLGIVNGLMCSVILFILNYMIYDQILLAITVSLSLLSVIVFAALFGTWVPMMLHKNKIDPALATGPFITTANDIFGLFLYFYISQAIMI